MHGSRGDNQPPRRAVLVTRVAIIPARGGSQRIPSKNIVPFEGKPLLAWSIEAALDSGLFEHVMVSTDNEEIARVAREFGAEVPFLRSAHADHHAPVSLATINMLDELSAHGRDYDVVVQLFAACPLRNSQDICDAVRFFDAHPSSFQLSCYELGWANPWWAARLDDANRPIPLFPDAWQQRSQDLPRLFCPTGATWIANTTALRQAGTFYGPDHRFCPMPWERAVDIDEPRDLDLARALRLTALPY